MKWKCYVLLYMLLMVTNIALAYQNEPDGFRGYKWGMSTLEVVKESEVEGNKVFYDETRSNSAKDYKIKIFNIQLKSPSVSHVNMIYPAEFYFFDNKLYKVGLTFYKDNTDSSIGDLRAIRQSLLVSMRTIYGEPTYRSDDKDDVLSSVGWKGNKAYVDMLTTYGTRYNKSFFNVLKVSLVSMKIDKQRRQWSDGVELKKAHSGW